VGTSVSSVEIKPERFGRYVLPDRIGVGGMAEAFRAIMSGVEGFQRKFVVKRIIAERDQSPYYVEMFVQEGADGSGRSGGGAEAACRMGR
jgi:hypothetical protein